MQILSINVGKPRDMLWKGRVTTTGIFKEPVAGRVRLRVLNFEGDGQADLSVHGGPSKAVYVYPDEHYEFWRRELPGMDLPRGIFGENLTTLGLREDGVHIGDRFRTGAAELMVTQPRLPCFKLGIRFGRDDIIKRFLESRRSGFYCAVQSEGEIEAGDPIEVSFRNPDAVTVADIMRLYLDPDSDPDLLRRVVRVEGLSEAWRTHFEEKIAREDKEPP